MGAGVQAGLLLGILTPALEFGLSEVLEIHRAYRVTRKVLSFLRELWSFSL